MTTIAYKDGVLAADRRLSGGSRKYECDKITNVGIGFLALAGAVDTIREIEAWFTAGRPAGRKPDMPTDTDFGACGFFVDTNGDLFNVTWPWLRLDPLDSNEMHAMGSGAGYALGAMAVGASARKSIEIAALFDECTGDGVSFVECPHKRESASGN